MTTLFTHDAFAAHEMGPHHPESPARVRAVLAELRATGLLDRLDVQEAPMARDEDILRAHTPDHWEALKAASPSSRYAVIDPDTAMNPFTLEAVSRAAGAVVEGVEAVVQGRAQTVFCAVRPPGHHAERDRAMGFCFVNSVAVGALYATEALGLERVAVVDFDVHHGNGTEEILADVPGVLMVSTFQQGIYPGRGERPLGQNMVNVPLPGGSDGKALRAAVLQEWLPALNDFAPELIIISAGFDAHRDDPLAGLRWSEADYEWVTEQLLEVAARHCEGRVVSSLEGGYEVAALGRSVACHVSALMRSETVEA
ncbi:MAG: histone deacetylase family protein [Burkholderiaceae bacterium]